jgi:hypothetical protein
MLYYILATISASLWTPILLKFRRNWSSRKNPVSLAILVLVAFVMWTAVAGFWLMSGGVTPALFAVSWSIVSNVIAIAFHTSFYMAGKRFGEKRN